MVFVNGHFFPASRHLQNALSLTGPIQPHSRDAFEGSLAVFELRSYIRLANSVPCRTSVARFFSLQGLLRTLTLHHSHALAISVLQIRRAFNEGSGYLLHRWVYQILH